MNRAKIITLFQPVEEITDEFIARFEGDPGGIFPGSRANGPGLWRVPLHVGPVMREVNVHIGGVWVWGDGRWRSLTWAPLPMERDLVPVDRLLPSFVGELGLTQDNRSLVLTGAYHPPFGVVGTLADGSGLHALARVTAQHLLADIAAALTHPATV